MIIRDNFSDTSDGSFETIFRQINVPLFQNKVYPTSEMAFEAEKGEVELIHSLISGFVFNRAFVPYKMNYDAHYQNEQSNSPIFKKHLLNVLNLLKAFGIENKKVIEVGCGKGIFFEMMQDEDIDCWGFDPTYEGDNPRITKAYFDEGSKGIDADVIIMRHTLEHIPMPFSFLHTIAKANNYKGFLFVEVPTFDWIVKKNAFWDIFYEHCNYFTEQSLSSMFENSLTGNFFNGQYIYLWADMSKIRSTIPNNLLKITKHNMSTFHKKLEEYKNILLNSKSYAIWGAGAKGSTFVNLLDADRKAIQYVIDINHAKQNKFVAGTGHPIFHPDILLQQPVQNILIMNENYAGEINEQIKQYNIPVKTLSL